MLASKHINILGVRFIEKSILKYHFGVLQISHLGKCSSNVPLNRLDNQLEEYLKISVNFIFHISSFAKTNNFKLPYLLAMYNAFPDVSTCLNQ